MSFIEAVLIGLIQGITEFLPISSDGHLVLIPSLFHLPAPNLNLISIVHQGTLLAILTYFYKDLWEIVVAVLKGLKEKRPFATPNSRLGWYIAVGTIPAVVVGLGFKDFFETTFTDPRIAAFCLFITAVLLIVGEQLRSGKKSLEQMTWTDAILVGCLQVIALLPGVSRSGSTIATGLWRGFDRATAGRFSFLLGVPAILGAGLLALVDLAEVGVAAGELPIYVVAFVVSAVSGYACIHFLLTWLRRHSLYPFAVYCVLMGAGYLLLK